MQTYKHFFSAVRIPGEEKDQFLLVDHKNDETEHIGIACRNQVSYLNNNWVLNKTFLCIKFFVLEFKKNEFPAGDVLLEQLKHIWHLSKEYESSAPTVGVLTTDNRRIWAKNRKKLLSSPSFCWI